MGSFYGMRPQGRGTGMGLHAAVKMAENGSLIVSRTGFLPVTGPQRPVSFPRPSCRSSAATRKGVRGGAMRQQDNTCSIEPAMTATCVRFDTWSFFMML
jgi:hypothetical protein